MSFWELTNMGIDPNPFDLSEKVLVDSIFCDHLVIDNFPFIKVWEVVFPSVVQLSFERSVELNLVDAGVSLKIEDQRNYISIINNGDEIYQTNYSEIAYDLINIRRRFNAFIVDSNLSINGLPGNRYLLLSHLCL